MIFTSLRFSPGQLYTCHDLFSLSTLYFTQMKKRTSQLDEPIERFCYRAYYLAFLTVLRTVFLTVLRTAFFFGLQIAQGPGHLHIAFFERTVFLTAFFAGVVFFITVVTSLQLYLDNLINYT